MNKKIQALILGIMCFALTLGICIQIKTVKSTDTTVSQNYEANNLKDEILKCKEKYDNKFKELEEAEKQLEKEREKTTQNNSELEEAQKKIEQARKEAYDNIKYVSFKDSYCRTDIGTFK